MKTIEQAFTTVGELVAKAAKLTQSGGEVLDAFEIAGMFYLRYKEAVVVEKSVEPAALAKTEVNISLPKQRKGKQ